MARRNFPALSRGSEGTLIQVKVIPRSSTNELGDLEAEAIRVKLTAPPVEGEANKALLKLLSRTLRVPRSDLEIVKGERSRHKTVCIRGVDVTQVMSRLGTKGGG